MTIKKNQGKLASIFILLVSSFLLILTPANTNAAGPELDTEEYADPEGFGCNKFWPGQGSLKPHNLGNNNYQVRLDFSLTFSELWSMRQCVPNSDYIELDFILFDFDIPEEYDDYSITATNLPGAVKDTSLYDATNPFVYEDPVIGVTGTSVLHITHGKNYYVVLSWNAAPKPGETPSVALNWQSSHWALPGESINGQSTQTFCANHGSQVPFCLFATTTVKITKGWWNGARQFTSDTNFSYTWNHYVPWEQYINDIVRWDSYYTWLVDENGRHFIPSYEDQICFEAQGAEIIDLGSTALSNIPDITGSHAFCKSYDPPGAGDSGVPPGTPSNEQWIARNHRGENGLDFNGDGDSDIFSANGSIWKVKYSGTGSWVTLGSSTKTLDVLAFGDFDCDGITDVFNANGTVWQVSYGGTSTWTTLASSVISMDKIAIVDADGDGCSDVFKSNGTNWNVAYSDTSGWKTIASSGVSLDNLIFGDFDSDGKTDAFRTNGGTWYVAHSLTSPWVTLNSSNADYSLLAVGDFGGGSKDDVFRANGSTWKISRAGTTSWEQTATSGVGLDQVIFGDFDGNGLTDIFRINGTKWKVAYDGTGPWVTIGTSSAVLERLAG